MASQEPAVSEEFTTFMRAYQNMVFSTAARLSGNDAQAEDIAQEVFVKAFEHFEDLRENPAAGGWLKTVATNLTINHLNRYRNRWRLFTDLSEPAQSLADPATPDTLAADLGARQRSALIDGAMRRLPPHQRLVLGLYHFEELSYDEIAVRLGISLAKVKTDIRRARAALAPMLKACGVADSDAGD
jgi:RNA polymerase sigma-70 factor, ECF subfamily